MRVQIIIPLTHATNPADHLGSSVDASGIIRLPNDVGLSVRVAPKPSRRAFPGSEVMVLFAEFTSGIAASVLANWIYERLRGKTPKVVIDNQAVSTDKKSEIEKVIRIPKQKVRRPPKRGTKRR